jgi:phospholipase/lecithinase/hemolysin
LAKGFDAKVLVTVMAGLNDVLQAYTTYKTQAAVPGATDADKVAALATATAMLQDAGIRLGKLVNGITNEGKGGRVIYATTPDLGLSPLALKDEVVTPGSSKILTDLTFAFNERFRVTVQNDGRYAGLVAADEVVQVMFKNPSSYSLVNISSGGCTAALPDCTPATLNDTTTATDGTVTLGAPGVYLWADDSRPGSNWHSRVGGAADSRARNNPF